MASRKNLQELGNETKGWVRKKVVGGVINSWRQGREEGEAAGGCLQSRGLDWWVGFGGKVGEQNLMISYLLL